MAHGGGREGGRRIRWGKEEKTEGQKCPPGKDGDGRSGNEILFPSPPPSPVLPLLFSPSVLSRSLPPASLSFCFSFPLPSPKIKMKLFRIQQLCNNGEKEKSFPLCYPILINCGKFLAILLFCRHRKKIPHEFLQIAHSILEVCRSKKVGWRMTHVLPQMPPKPSSFHHCNNFPLAPSSFSPPKKRMHPTNQPSPSRNSKSLPLLLPLFLPCGWVGRWCFEYT